MQGASPLASPRLSLRGTGSPCRCGKLNGGLPQRCRLGECQRYPAGGAGGAVACRPCRCGVRRGGLPALSPAYAAFSFAFVPIPPPPFPSGEGGDYRFILPGAAAPGTPALNRLRHLQFPPYRYPAKGCLWLGAKTTEMLSHGQSRQPRRGGTGGEELRRLRWSSPPGQGEQVPPGFSSPPPPHRHHSGRDSQCRRGSALPPFPPCPPRKTIQTI